MRPEPNPYAPPAHETDAGAGSGGVGESTPELEAIRRAHLNAEINVKTLGFLEYLAAAGTLFGGVATLTSDVALGGITIVFGVLLGLGGYWLRQLDRRGRLVFTGITALGMLGVLLNDSERGMAYELGRMIWPLIFLGAVWSRKATTVMSAHYREVVIPATPQVKRKTSAVTIALVVLLSVGLIVAAALVLTS